MSVTESLEPSNAPQGDHSSQMGFVHRGSCQTPTDRGSPGEARSATCHYPTPWQTLRSRGCHMSLPNPVAVLAKPGLPHDFNSTNTDMGHYTIPIIAIIDTTNNTTNTYNNTFLISHSPTLSDIPLNNTQLRLGPHRPAPQCPSRLLQQHIHLHHTDTPPSHTQHPHSNRIGERSSDQPCKCLPHLLPQQLHPIQCIRGWCTVPE